VDSVTPGPYSLTHSYSYSIWHGTLVQPTREPEAHGVPGTKLCKIIQVCVREPCWDCSALIAASQQGSRFQQHGQRRVWAQGLGLGIWVVTVIQSP
jgi:hypothetical protein